MRLWLLGLCACGRLDFDPQLHGSDGALPPNDTTPTRDTPPARIVHAGIFVARSPGTGPTDSFNVQAHAAGNAIVMQVSCAANAIPTAVSVTAPGWTFTQLGPITASAASQGATSAATSRQSCGLTASTTVRALASSA